MKPKTKKKFLLTFLGSIVMGTLTVGSINWNINRIGQPKVMKAEDCDPAPVALVFGAYAYPNGKPSHALQDRLDTALELYQNQSVKKLILSGDHGKKDYDEVNSMKQYLESKGVPKSDLFLDHAGFDTYDSLYRAREIFGVKRLILVTQEFHLPRALYIGNSLGLECQGAKADKRRLASINSLNRREILAKVKAFFDVHSGREPVYLGQAIPIDGDSALTHDKG